MRRHRLHGPSLFLVSVLCALTASACASGPRCARLRSLGVITDADANSQSATRLDVVLIHDRSLTSALPKTAPEWFAQKRALLNTQPRALTVVALEVPPALVLPVRLPRAIHRAKVVRAYAGYQDARGQTPVDLTSYRRAVLHLHTHDFSVHPGDLP